MSLQSTVRHLNQISDIQIWGKVLAVRGLLVEAAADFKGLALGNRCLIHTHEGRTIPAEVVGFREYFAQLMPLTSLEGVGPGCRVDFYSDPAVIFPDAEWLGRVINGLAKPIDAKGVLHLGERPMLLRTHPPSAHVRARVGVRLDVGIRAINTFLTCCVGQRLGLFAGSGVGKSVLLSMLAKFTNCDVCVIGMIGERGREVKEFLEETLGPEGLKKSVVVVATSDEPPLLRRQAAYTTMAIAEYFRDQGKSVLMLMDSVTRLAMAQREIGLSAGEPPTTKGYTPSVFTELAKVLERAGPGFQRVEEEGVVPGGMITAFFTVLVDGDDHNEPIADAARGILDGHIVLDRSIAEKGHYPAINILRSLSRMVPKCHQLHEQQMILKGRHLLSIYEDMEDMIRLGAYRQGSDPEIDQAIKIMPFLNNFLCQRINEHESLGSAFEKLSEILGE